MYLIGIPLFFIVLYFFPASGWAAEIDPVAVTPYPHQATLVTAWYKCAHDKLPSNEYKQWIRNFMSIDAPVVIFVDEDSINYLRDKYPEHHFRKYIIKHISLWLTSLPVFEWENNLGIENELSMCHRKISNEKVFFVADAIHRNIYNTGTFVWTDIDSSREDGRTYPGYPASTRFNHQVVTFSITNQAMYSFLTKPEGDLSDEHLLEKSIPPSTYEFSSHFAGGKQAMNHFANLHMETLKRLQEKKMLKSVDQNLYALEMAQYPSMFSPVYVSDELVSQANSSLGRRFIMFHQWSNDVDANEDKGINRDNGIIRDLDGRVLAHYDKSCPRLIVSDLRGSGVGDRLEHYFYALYWSTVLETDLLLHPFVYYHEYFEVMHDILGIKRINRYYNVDLAKSTLNMTDLAMDKAELERLHSIDNIPCHTLLHVSIEDCPGNWCFFTSAEYSKIFPKIVWGLRKARAASKCTDAGFSMTEGSSEKPVNVLVHVRTGDICVKCSVEYFSKILLLLNKYFGSKYRLHIETPSDLKDDIDELFRLNDAKVIVGAPLIQTVCRMLTTDVLIATGSSLAFTIGLFGQPWHPLIFEEVRKDIGDHFFAKDVAIHLHDGIPVHSEQEIVDITENFLQIKSGVAVSPGGGIKMPKPGSTPKLPRDGGKEFQLECPWGSHITQFVGRAGGWIDCISIVCSDGTRSEMKGGGGGSPISSTFSENGYSAVLLSSERGVDAHVNSIGLTVKSGMDGGFIGSPLVSGCVGCFETICGDGKRLTSISGRAATYTLIALNSFVCG